LYTRGEIKFRYLVGTISSGTRSSRMLPFTWNWIAINILYPMRWSTATKMLIEALIGTISKYLSKNHPEWKHKNVLRFCFLKPETNHFLMNDWYGHLQEILPPHFLYLACHVSNLHDSLYHIQVKNSTCEDLSNLVTSYILCIIDPSNN